MLDLLEYLSGCAEPVKLKDIVAALGFPKSSAHALAQTLVSRGYAIQDTAERYVLVHASRHRSATRAHEARLLSAAHPVMEGLRDASGETVVLAVRNTRGEAKRLAKCVSRQAIRFDVDLDGQSDSYCTATGRLLLAHWDEALANAYLVRVPLLARTPKTPTDPDVIPSPVRADSRGGRLDLRRGACAGLDGPGSADPRARRQRGRGPDLGVVTMRYHQRSDDLIAMLKDAAGLISMRLGYREA